MSKTNDPTEDLPDTIEGCVAEMHALDVDIASIQANLTTEAACNYTNRGLAWVSRANYARRMKSLRRVALQEKAASLRKLERQQQRETWARAFVEVARELLPKEKFDLFVQEADSRLAAGVSA